MGLTILAIRALIWSMIVVGYICWYMLVFIFKGLIVLADLLVVAAGAVVVLGGRGTAYWRERRLIHSKTKEP